MDEHFEAVKAQVFQRLAFLLLGATWYDGKAGEGVGRVVGKK